METPVKLIRAIFDLIRISLRDGGTQDAASARHGRALGATWSSKEGPPVSRTPAVLSITCSRLKPATVGTNVCAKSDLAHPDVGVL